MELTKNTSLAAPGALTHRLQYRNACKIINGRKEAQRWHVGPRFLGASVNFR